MSYVILGIIMLAIGVIGGYLVYRNNKKKIDELICRYDKEIGCQ